MIACFDAKYRYAFWRPITAVPAGDTDGNDGTIGAPAWVPLLPATPNHPEYPSFHSCVTPAFAQIIGRFLGTDNIKLSVPSITLGDRYFATVQDLSTEVGNARIWGGIPLPFSCRRWQRNRQTDDGAGVVPSLPKSRWLKVRYRPNAEGRARYLGLQPCLTTGTPLTPREVTSRRRSEGSDQGPPLRLT